MNELLTTLILVFFSELVGATELIIFGLAMKYRSFVPVFSGALLAHALLDFLAIIAGAYIGAKLPHNTLLAFSGIFFILLGLLSGKEKETKPKKHAFLAVFSMVAIAEIGDKTQIASGLLAAQYQTIIPVFLGAILGLALALSANVFIGTYLAKKTSTKWLNVVSRILFVLFGIYTLMRVM